MIKRSAIYCTCVIMCLFINLQPNVAAAQANNSDNANLGIGLLLGEPTGVSVKLWNNRQTAFNIGAAWSLAGKNEALHLHSDFLLHMWFKDTENLNFYYGIGGRIIFADDANVGIRVPFGLNYVFQSIPFDVFVEAAPIIDLSPDTEFAGNGGVGLRYYF